MTKLVVTCWYFFVVSPEITPFTFGEVPVHSGQLIQVQCIVSEGDLPLTIEWFMNDQPVEEYMGISVTKIGKRSSILSIDSVTHEHVGNYTCKTRNAAGEVTFTSELHVNGY